MNQFLKNTFVVAFTLLTVTTFAQKKMSNGIIKYEITDIQGDNPQMSMLKGTMFNMAFLGSKQKMDIGIMGGLMRVQTIVDATDPAKTTVLMDMMGQKIELADVGEQFSQLSTLGMGADSAEKGYEIKYDKKDKKKIAGYKAHKAILTPNGGPAIEMYVSKKIKPENSQIKDLFKDLVGFPLQMSVNAEGVGITITAQNINRDIDSDNFKIPEGYQKMTMEEFQEQMGGMMDFGG